MILLDIVLDIIRWNFDGEFSEDSNWNLQLDILGEIKVVSPQKVEVEVIMSVSEDRFFDTIFHMIFSHDFQFHFFESIFFSITKNVNIQVIQKSNEATHW